ncbi:MAG: hypothetical protein PV358_01420, partial [Acidimicrobiales bacterium]|nr:hypothetical protein [Acidimicrobiales bacterium]
MTTSSPAPPSTTASAGGDAVERDRARVVAAAVVDAAAATGTTPDDGLAVWSLAGGRPEPDPRRAGAVGVDALAAVLEGATDAGRRRAHGLHVTPRWLADRLVALALPDDALTTLTTIPKAGGPTVCDPACGGGAFLLAAARRL